jgi:hypothetical protein
VHDDKLTDFRSVLDDLGGSAGGRGGDQGVHRAQQLVEEYQMRVTKHKLGEQGKKNRGLGRLLRGALEPAAPSPHAAFSSAPSSPAAKLTTAPSVGADGRVTVTVSKKEEQGERKKPVKRKGGLFEWVEQRETEKAEEAAVKREEMETMYRQKMQAKQEQQQEQQRRAQAQQDGGVY